MRSGASRREALAARDARQALLDGHLARGSTLVALALNVPGSDKSPPGAAALFARALSGVEAALPGGRLVHHGHDALGPFALLCVPATPVNAKAACVAVESASAAARLVDLDVLGPDGVALGRSALGLPPRACLLCDRPAVECIRVGRHPAAEVVARAHALLADPSA
jgi:holo-ACP synthase